MRIDHPSFYYNDNEWDHLKESIIIQYFNILESFLNKSIHFIDRIEVVRSINYCIKRIKNFEKLGIPPNRIYDELRKYKIEWFEYIVSDDRTVRYYFQTKTIDNEPINREEELKKLIFSGSKQNHFSDFIGPNGTVDVKGRLFIKYAINWFLSRYDLQTAARMNAIFNKDWGFVISLPFRSILFDMNEIFKQKISNHFWYIPIVNIIELLSIFSFFLLLAVAICKSYFKKEFLDYKLFLPRLIGGIILGYIPLFMTQEIWEWLFVFDQSVLIGLSIFAFCFSGLYLFLEVYNNLDNIRQAAVRSLAVLFLGLIYSLIIGLLLFDFFSYIFVLDLETLNRVIIVEGLFSFYDPIRLFAYFPIALTIGIFLQIFWEEKPITHPI